MGVRGNQRLGRDEITVGFVINEIARQTNTAGMVIPRDRRAQKSTVTIHQEAEKPTQGLAACSDVQQLLACGESSSES